MKTAVALTLLATLALLGTTSLASARLDPSTDNSFSHFYTKALSHIFDNEEADSPVALRKREGQTKATVLIEYAVLPPVQGKFVELFKDLLEKTKDEEGVKVFGLSRLVDENLKWYIYSEWEDSKAYGEHFSSDYFKEYLEGIAKIGVVWQVHLLDQVAGIAA